MFERARFGLIGEGEISDNSPRSAVDRRSVLSCIVTGEARAEIVGEARVVTAVVERALEEVHVVHGPSKLEARSAGAGPRNTRIRGMSWREFVRRVVAGDLVED